MEQDLITISASDSLAALNRSEIDMQVSTAKAYPREINKVLNEIVTYATIDQETAVECFYSLPRAGSRIEGLSVRMAEVFAGAWGNLRAQSRIIANDGKTITAQGVCYDVEKNVAISVEVKRRITDRNGRTLNEDMQTVIGNAASSIAFRNAVFKVIPKSVTKKAVEQIKQVAIGKAKDLTTMRTNMIAWYNQLGVPQDELLKFMNVASVDEITNEMVFELRGLGNAIKEGDTTIEEAIRKPLKERATAETYALAEMAMEEAMRKAAQGSKSDEVEQQTAETEETAQNAPKEETEAQQATNSKEGRTLV